MTENTAAAVRDELTESGQVDHFAGVDETTAVSTEDGDRGPEGHTPDDKSVQVGHDSNEDTFPRDYVEKLRDENAKYRQRAGQADDLARRVHRLQVAATGLLADPDDLEFNEDHLDDEEALTAAIEDLLARKPHLAARRPRGDVGQGVTDAGGTDLAAILRRAAN